MLVNKKGKEMCWRKVPIHYMSWLIIAWQELCRNNLTVKCILFSCCVFFFEHRSSLFKILFILKSIYSTLFKMLHRSSSENSEGCGRGHESLCVHGSNSTTLKRTKDNRRMETASHTQSKLSKGYKWWDSKKIWRPVVRNPSSKLTKITAEIYHILRQIITPCYLKQ